VLGNVVNRCGICEAVAGISGLRGHTADIGTPIVHGQSVWRAVLPFALTLDNNQTCDRGGWRGSHVSPMKLQRESVCNTWHSSLVVMSHVTIIYWPTRCFHKITYAEVSYLIILQTDIEMSHNLHFFFLRRFHFKCPVCQSTLSICLCLPKAPLL
jgi:hypothetical protein